MIASVAEVIRSEWEGGSTDDAICELLTRSGIRSPSPHSFRKWTPERLREVAGDRPRSMVRR
jgi:hypothetical protein